MQIKKYTCGASMKVADSSAPAAGPPAADAARAPQQARLNPHLDALSSLYELCLAARQWDLTLMCLLLQVADAAPLRPAITAWPGAEGVADEFGDYPRLLWQCTQKYSP